MADYNAMVNSLDRSLNRANNTKNIEAKLVKAKKNGGRESSMINKIFWMKQFQLYFFFY